MHVRIGLGILIQQRSTCKVAYLKAGHDSITFRQKRHILGAMEGIGGIDWLNGMAGMPGCGEDRVSSLVV